MIESRCGLRCSDCSFREAMGCKGCIHMDKPFWADSCPVKSCCEQKELQHCGECGSFVCSLLHTFAYDMEQSDIASRECSQKLHFVMVQHRAVRSENTAKFEKKVEIIK